ncbi:MAG: glutathione S-transferase C-terminal domain-containing protein [Limnobacter sp.]|nr:glutathione S-transferase C-terminal domain-containing protein [Limnobacter sp.]
MSKKPHYTLYGWHLSYFTGKSLCYLRYKRAHFTLKPVNIYTLMVTIKKKTGEAVMPVLKSDSGAWIQDTSSIIDRIESEITQRPVVPSTPVHRFLSYWIEAWGDEWWIPMAMYTRWAFPENYALFEKEAGSALLPFAPRFLQNRAAAKPAKMLRGMLPTVGIVPAQYKAMDLYMEHMLNALDAHFARHPFLLGGRPTLGDFGLVGTMYGHLARDPWPKKNLIDPRVHLSAWVKRMSNPESYTEGELFANDEIPDTLIPVIRSIADEFAPMVEQTGQKAAAIAREKGLNKKLPRSVGLTQTTMAGLPFERHGLGIKVWMAQRALDSFNHMTTQDQQAVHQFLNQHTAQTLANLNLPRVERRALNIAVTALPTTLEKSA